MLAYLLALAIINSPATEKIEGAVRSYVNHNFGSNKVEYQFDFRRVNWNLFPAEIDSARVLRIGKKTPSGNTVFTIAAYKANSLKAVPVSIGITVRVDALVATVPIEAGEKLHDIMVARRVISGKGQFPVTNPQELESKQARTYIAAGSTIYSSMYESIPVINSGDSVEIVVEKGLVRIAAQGIARQKGGIGDIIRVVNTGSKKVMRAEIVDSVTVAIR